jgi:hypothetical protein
MVRELKNPFLRSDPRYGVWVRRLIDKLSSDSVECHDFLKEFLFSKEALEFKEFGMWFESFVRSSIFYHSLLARERTIEFLASDLLRKHPIWSKWWAEWMVNEEVLPVMVGRPEFEILPNWVEVTYDYMLSRYGKGATLASYEIRTLLKNHPRLVESSHWQEKVRWALKDWGGTPNDLKTEMKMVTELLLSTKKFGFKNWQAAADSWIQDAVRYNPNAAFEVVLSQPDFVELPAWKQSVENAVAQFEKKWTAAAKLLQRVLRPAPVPPNRIFLINPIYQANPEVAKHWGVWMKERLRARVVLDEELRTLTDARVRANPAWQEVVDSIDPKSIYFESRFTAIGVLEEIRVINARECAERLSGRKSLISSSK